MVKPIKAIVNLAGAPLLSFQRWTDAYKNEVVQSRIGTTKAFVDFVRDLKEDKPEVYISMSGVSECQRKKSLVVSWHPRARLLQARSGDGVYGIIGGR